MKAELMYSVEVTGSCLCKVMLSDAEKDLYVFSSVSLLFYHMDSLTKQTNFMWRISKSRAEQSESASVLKV